MSLTCNGHDWIELAKKLQAYFKPDEIEWKVNRFTYDESKAVMLAYVDARAIQNRLDRVAGPGGWRTSYQRWGTHGVLCKLELRFLAENGQVEWVGKTDGADDTQVEATKGGISSALKRVASVWGIGRYLYDFPDAMLPAKKGKNGKPTLAKWGDRPPHPQQFLPGREPWNLNPKPAPKQKPEPDINEFDGLYNDTEKTDD